MKIMITKYPNQELFTKTRDIPKDEIRSDTYSQIGSSMLDILHKQGGIGLSANQVGLPLNMCVVEVKPNDPKILLNPRIVKQSDATVDSQEGCLSLPGLYITLKRHKTVTVEYETVTGETETLEAEGLLGSCLQHEIDHLKGVLMINRLNTYHRAKAIKQLNKFSRGGKK